MYLSPRPGAGAYRLASPVGSVVARSDGAHTEALDEITAAAGQSFAR